MSASRFLTLCAALSLLPLSAMAQSTTVETVTSTINSTAKTVDSVTQGVDQASKAADTVKKTLGEDTTSGKPGSKSKTGSKDKDSAKTMPEKAQKYGNSAEHRMDDVKKKHGKKN